MATVADRIELLKQRIQSERADLMAEVKQKFNYDPANPPPTKTVTTPIFPNLGFTTDGESVIKLTDSGFPNLEDLPEVEEKP